MKKTMAEYFDEFFRAAQIEDAPERAELFLTKYPAEAQFKVVATVCLRREKTLYLGVEIDDGRRFVCAKDTALDQLCAENIASLFRNVPGYTGQGWIEVES